MTELMSTHRQGNTTGHALQPRAASRITLAMFVLALGSVAVMYRSSYASLIEKWINDAAYSHGFLIVPISLWLAWRKRREIAVVNLEPSAWGSLAALACAVVWLVARGSGVLVLEQFAAVALIPALVLAALGWPAVRVLLFPLAFLLLAVPFGRSLVPALMQTTADISTLLLRSSGVPVFRSHMHISIPAGSFEVARACSGLNYLITSFVLGILYGYLNFRGWWKRVICAAAFVVIPLLLNALRVYITILVSHWTDMRFGPGYEHVTFGRIFFVASMLLLFWLGRRWHDDDVWNAAPAGTTKGLPGPVQWAAWWPLLLASGLAMTAPPFSHASITRARAVMGNASSLIHFPTVSHPWRGPARPADDAWRPSYLGGIVERRVRYDDANGIGVDAFVAVYGLGKTFGTEMISYRNSISVEERNSLPPERRRRVKVTDNVVFDVREVMVIDGGEPRVVWYWFVVGNWPVAGNTYAKALEALMFVTRNADSERVVVLSTGGDHDASGRLEAFVKSHGSCVVQGFQREGCRR